MVPELMRIRWETKPQYGMVTDLGQKGKFVDTLFSQNGCHGHTDLLVAISTKYKHRQRHTAYGTKRPTVAQQLVSCEQRTMQSI